MLIFRRVVLVSLFAGTVACGGGGKNNGNGSGATDTTAPTVPAGLQAVALSSSSIRCTWNASTDNVGAVGYAVFRNGALIEATANLEYTDTGLTPGTTYVYTVAAADAAGNASGKSAPASATTLAPPADTTPPTVPANLTAIAASTSRIDLAWTASTDNVGVTGYRIYRNGSQVGISSSALYSDTGLSPSTSYTYTVAAVDAAANVSGQSGSASATTLAPPPDTTPPTVPPNLTAIAASTSRIDLAWAASTDNVGVTGYKVYRAGVQVGISIGTSYSDIGLSPSTVYSYTVAAYDAADNSSAQSPAAVARTAALWTLASLPDTGQTTSYFAGDDGSYLIRPPSYGDNANGTVTDNVTGLVWQKQDDGTTMTWTAAVDYCEGLALGGFTDWRLPGDLELMSIVDYGRIDPAISVAYFTNTQQAYWSSTSLASSPTMAWFVAFHAGNGVNSQDKTSPLAARCVRGGPWAVAGAQFHDDGDGGITDARTGLTWQKADGGAKTWQDAVSYCEGLTLAGKTDWRMPNVKEMRTIIDNTRQDPALDTTYFDLPSPNANYWSSTNVISRTSYAWILGMGSGAVGFEGESGSYAVRCVRGGVPPPPPCIVVCG
jgi:chitodextrinase